MIAYSLDLKKQYWKRGLPEMDNIRGSVEEGK